MGIYYSEPKFNVNDFAFRIYTKKYISKSYLYSIEIDDKSLPVFENGVLNLQYFPKNFIFNVKLIVFLYI